MECYLGDSFTFLHCQCFVFLAIRSFFTNFSNSILRQSKLIQIQGLNGYNKKIAENEALMFVTLELFTQSMTNESNVKCPEVGAMGMVIPGS